MTEYRTLNNVDQPEDLKKSELREAVNVDIDRKGNIRRRRGFTQINGGAAHSLFATDDICLFARGNTLCRLLDDNTDQVLFSDLNADQPLDYVEVNGAVYWVSDQDTGYVRDGVNRPWGMPTPSLPLISADVGSLTAGCYQVTLTYQHQDGRESGAREGAVFDLAMSGGLRLDAIPQPLDPEIDAVNVYMTPPDGDSFYFAATVPRGITNALIASCDFSIPLTTQFFDPPTRGHSIAYFNGRILVAHFSTLWFSEPLGYDYFNFAHNFFYYPEPISVIGAVDDGIYVVADKTYFLSGADLPEATQRVVSDLKAVPNTLECLDASVLPITDAAGTGLVWATEEGVVAGLNGGQFVKLMDQRVVFGHAQRGASLLREQDGIRQYLSLLQGGGEANGFAASDIVVAEVRRNGVFVR